MKQKSSVIIARRGCKNDNVIYTHYEVAFDQHKNILQVLREIFAEQDRTLSFRTYCCNRGVCGSCTMIINGKVRRACMATMTKVMTIEPFEKYGVIKDLIAILDS